MSNWNENQAPTIIRLMGGEFDLNEILASITLPTTGAACFFSGMVRAHTSRGGERETEYLHYEAYDPMAERTMEQVAEEIRERFPAVQGIAIVHRVGKLYPETPTVLIACTAAHRDTGVFEAARYGIDRLKQIVTIWKKEVGPEGEEEWVMGDYDLREEIKENKDRQRGEPGVEI
jgi:molybdopterin synthase catalytic subunit